MPEMLTKYPDSALAVLKSAGAKCGMGLKQQILTNCPPEQFCVLPQGEICVYSIEDANKMTQLSPADFANVIGNIPTIYSNINIVLLMLSCLVGIIVGMWLKRK